MRRRSDFLRDYQSAAYAQRFADRIARLAAAENKAAPGSTAIAEAAARSLFKLMAVKDEYEVARLYTDGSFARQLAAEFDSFERLEFHLAPPVLGRRDASGRPRKSSVGPWMLPVFRALARCKRLRGTAFDPFSYLRERRAEREDLTLFSGDCDRIEALLAGGASGDALEAAAGLASLPMLLRGYGHVKDANRAKLAEERARLLQRCASSAKSVPQLQAAE